MIETHCMERIEMFCNVLHKRTRISQQSNGVMPMGLSGLGPAPRFVFSIQPNQRQLYAALFKLHRNPSANGGSSNSGPEFEFP